MSHYYKSIWVSVLFVLFSTKSILFAGITPANVTPPTVNPATVTPQTITPPVVTPPIITPAMITPPVTTPATTTPAVTTPMTVNPARINTGPSSEATSTSISIPNTTASDAESKTEILPAGMVVKVNGTVKLLNDHKKTHPLKDKSLFYPNDIIYTKNNSKVAIRFNDGSFIVLGPDSALEIKKYQFTVPSKGKMYEGSSTDKAEVKLFKGNLKAKLGSLVTVNKPDAFELLTPRGRVTLTDPKKSPDLEVIYNNKIGLAVKALGLLNNSKGQVLLNDKQYGVVSAVIDSAPAFIATIPLAFSDPAFVSTAAFYSVEVTKIDSVYNENLMSQEEHLIATDNADSAADSDTGEDNEAINFNDAKGDDDGDEVDDEEDDNSESDEDSSADSSNDQDNQDNNDENENESEGDSGDE